MYEQTLPHAQVSHRNSDMIRVHATFHLNVPRITKRNDQNNALIIPQHILHE